MIFSFIAAVCILAAVIFYVSSRSIKNKDRYFLDSFRETRGTVYGYRRIDYSDDKPAVSFIVDGKEIRMEVRSEKMSPQTHPVGTQVRIGYVPARVMGINVYDARVINQDNSVPTSARSTRLLVVIASIILTAALVFIIIALQTTIKWR